ncbi:hypothetical protein HCH39_05575 [Enterobacter kobei]|uniref:hypothetical protein n=1 Tax=Enterobacter kobei TaxID=208224 RepID=UPI001C8C0588|nr:hypothetical protein [Enterobacter kobei]ELE9727533.1 hypothetical protein [Enterobacter kobei]MBX8889175.1 hypothetical protein [Enterobacter kobei]
MSETTGIKIGKSINVRIDGNVVSGFDTAIDIDEIHGGSVSRNVILSAESQALFQKAIDIIIENAVEIKGKISTSAPKEMAMQIATSCAEGKASFLQTIESLTTICSNVVSFWPALHDVLVKIYDALPG